MTVCVLLPAGGGARLDQVRLVADLSSARQPPPEARSEADLKTCQAAFAL